MFLRSPLIYRAASTAEELFLRTKHIQQHPWNTDIIIQTQLLPNVFDATQLSLTRSSSYSRPQFELKSSRSQFKIPRVCILVKNSCIWAAGRVLKNERHVRGAGLSSKQTWKMTSDQRTMGKTPSSATMKSKKGTGTRSSPWPVASIANISIKRIFKMFKNMILYLTSCVGGFGRVEMEPRKEIRKGCRAFSEIRELNFARGNTGPARMNPSDW